MAYERPININITKDMGGHENNEYNGFNDYIIILQGENKNHIANITSFKEKIENYKENEDKYDNIMRYMKSLLQNLNDLKKKIIQ
jgi:hypothetical protein